MEEPKFDPSRLKKKKKKVKVNPSLEEKVEGKIYFTEEEKNSLKEHHGNSEMDKVRNEPYTYDEMLSMLYKNVEEEIRPKKNKLPLPNIQNDGFGRGIKTSVTNYRTICNQLERDEQHVLLYLNVEIICKKKVSENGVLTMMGRYNQNEFLKVVKNYIIEYVDCKTCGGRHTCLVKEQGITFVSCMDNQCRGRRSVAKLK